jgi:undecaprenyl-diphosphatase
MRWVAAAWVLSLLGFAVVAVWASQRDYFPGDLWFSRQVQDVDSSAFGALLDYTEDLSDWPLLVFVYLGGAGALFLAAGWQQALLMAGALAGRLANSGFKEIIGRPRPSLSLVEADGQPSSLSFPSGHAEGTILLWGILFYFATVYLKDARLRLPAQAACIWVVVGTGLERVYVGHHWASDVIGGFWVGGLILAVLIAADQLARRRRAVVAYS